MINNIKDCTTLNNGLEMPWLGFGVWRMDDGDETVNSVLTAIETGYRSIDTATIYKNEKGVGQAIKDAGVAREEIFLTTKVWNDDQRAGRVAEAFEESLEKLQTDYVDLYLIHWPVAGHYLKTWEVMEKIYESGRARAVGVSNFMTHHLKDLMAHSDLIPAVNQVEFHPSLVQTELRAFCKANGIQFESWSPLKKGQIVDMQPITDLTKKYEKSHAQIVLRWNMQHGIVTIPKSSKPHRIKENMEIFDFELSQEDMGLIDALDTDERIGPNPDKVDF